MYLDSTALLAWCTLGNIELEKRAEVINEEGYNDLIKELNNYSLLPDIFSFASEQRYTYAQAAYSVGEIKLAEKVFNDIIDYKDAESKAKDSRYQMGLVYMAQEDYGNAIDAFDELISYKDADNRKVECQYRMGIALMESGDYDGAIEYFKTINECRTHLSMATSLHACSASG